MRNMQIGDIVLLEGHIIEVKQIDEGSLVRSVSIKTQSSIFHRPMNKCVLVLSFEEQSFTL